MILEEHDVKELEERICSNSFNPVFYNWREANTELIKFFDSFSVEDMSILYDCTNNKYVYDVIYNYDANIEGENKFHILYTTTQLLLTSVPKIFTHITTNADKTIIIPMMNSFIDEQRKLEESAFKNKFYYCLGINIDRRS